MFLDINARTGNYNLMDPDETYTIITVECNELDFSARVTYPKRRLRNEWVESAEWTKVLEEMVQCKPRQYVGNKKELESVEEFLEENRGRIEEEWKEHRIEQIEEELVELGKELRDLAK